MPASYARCQAAPTAGDAPPLTLLRLTADMTFDGLFAAFCARHPGWAGRELASVLLKPKDADEVLVDATDAAAECLEMVDSKACVVFRVAGEAAPPAPAPVPVPAPAAPHAPQMVHHPYAQPAPTPVPAPPAPQMLHNLSVPPPQQMHSVPRPPPPTTFYSGQYPNATVPQHAMQQWMGLPRPGLFQPPAPLLQQPVPLPQKPAAWVAAPQPVSRTAFGLNLEDPSAAGHVSESEPTTVSTPVLSAAAPTEASSNGSEAVSETETSASPQPTPQKAPLIDDVTAGDVSPRLSESSASVSSSSPVKRRGILGVNSVLRKKVASAPSSDTSSQPSSDVGPKVSYKDCVRNGAKPVAAAKAPAPPVAHSQKTVRVLNGTTKEEYQVPVCDLVDNAGLQWLLSNPGKFSKYCQSGEPHDVKTCTYIHAKPGRRSLARITVYTDRSKTRTKEYDVSDLVDNPGLERVRYEYSKYVGVLWDNSRPCDPKKCDFIIPKRAVRGY